jgi:hypothetical protein
MRQIFLPPLFVGLFAACSSVDGGAVTESSSEAWTTGTPACGAVIASWNGINAYSNGKCFGNVNCTNCDGAGFSVHTSSSNGQLAYGGAWQCVELVTRTFDSKYKIWLSNNAGTPLCNSAAATSGLTVHYGSGPEPIAGDALVWNYNGGIGHTAQNWGSPTGYAGTGSTPWNGSNFGAPSDSTGGFTPECWIHVNANTTGTCVYGNGLYCGGNGVTGDADTLYTCTNGVLTVDQVCGVSCTHNPKYVNDACAPCPNGDGTYCGGTAGVGKDPRTVYLCKNAQVTALETCSFGCGHMASTSTDAWNDGCLGLTANQSAIAPAPAAPAATTTPTPHPSTQSSGCNAGGVPSSGAGNALLALLGLTFIRRRGAPGSRGQ